MRVFSAMIVTFFVFGSYKSSGTGGVDVGNISAAVIPQTHALLFYPANWTGTSNWTVLTLKNLSGSVISAQRSELSGLTSPNALGLQQYLQGLYPERNYKILSVNGMEGVRADLQDTPTHKQSDIYLISELKDFLHIESDLRNSDNGIVLGDRILLTVRVEYKGVAYPHREAKTVTLPAYSLPTQARKRAAFSMAGDCYSYVDPNCEGVSFLFGNGAGAQLDVGNGGYDHGRIIELGPDSEVPFDEIRVEGKFLLAPLTKVALADIYPFANVRGDQGSDSYDDSMEFRPGGEPRDCDLLSVDSRPYGKRRGFYKLAFGTALESVTQAQVEALSASEQMDSYVSFRDGDVFAVLLENYNDKTILAFRVERAVPGGSVQLAIRYLYRGKTVYSQDRD